MESGLNGRLDLFTSQVQKTPQKNKEMSGIIASTRIPDPWATSDQSFEEVLSHVEKIEAADLEEHRKTLTEVRRCNCAKTLRRQTKNLWTSTWSVSWSDSATSHHLRNCQNWYPSQEVCTTKLSVFHVHFLAAMALSASVEISKKAGKIYKISPNLTFRGWVNGSSPAFALFKDLQKIFRDGDLPYLDKRSKWDKQIPLLTCGVRRLLREGTVSPHEVDENGRTLLHNALLCTGDGDLLHRSPAFEELVRTLLDARVAINEVDLAGKTAFDYLASSLNTYNLFKHVRNLSGELLAKNGAEMSDVFLKEGASKFQLTVELHGITMLEPWQDATECGPLSLAVLRKSEQDIIRILRAKPSSIHELNRRKLNPLHLACCWPRGIQLLLDAGANNLVHQIDICDRFPISYSTTFPCVDAVQLFLDAGSAFSSPGWNGESEEVLGILGLNSIPCFLLRSLQERRRKLFELAKLTLPAEVWADLDVPTDRLLDGRAAEIQRVLIDAGIEIPKSISVSQRPGSVYHSYIVSAKQADQLWDAGFRDIDSSNERGHTPIMVNRDGPWFEYDQWLLDHGADLHGEVSYVYYDEFREGHRVTGLTKLHYIAHNLGWSGKLLVTPKVDSAPRVVNEPLIKFEGLLIQTGCLDDCHCACSSGGCAPFTNLLKAMNKRRGLYEVTPKESSRSRRLLLQQLESPGHPASSAPMLSNIVEKVIRFETFEALQLIHTCCEFDYYSPLRRRYTLEEVHEIHDEWEELLSKHEDLVSEFCHKIQEFGGTLTFFLEGYWQTRMDAVLKEEKPYSEEEKRKLREIGVILEKVPDETEQKSKEGFVYEDEDFTDGD